MEPEDIEELKKVQAEAHRVAELLENDYRQTDNKKFVNMYAIVYAAATRSRVTDADNQYIAQDELYKMFQVLLAEVINRVPLPDGGVSDDVVFAACLRKWQHFKVLQRWMLRTFAYLSRFYIAHCHKKSLEYVSLSIFYTQLYRKVSGKVSSVLVRMVREERRGNLVDAEKMRLAVEVAERMTFGEGAVAHQTEFIEPFLQDTAEFYRVETNRWVAENSVADYLEQASKWLEDESQRAQRMLPSKLQHALVAVVEKEVLEVHLQQLLHNASSGFVAMLRDMRKDQLSLAFRVISRLKGPGLEPMAAILCDHCKQAGGSITAQYSGGTDVDYKSYCREYVDLHEQYMTLLGTEFKSNGVFQRAVKDAFEFTVNAGVTLAGGEGGAAAPASPLTPATPAVGKASGLAGPAGAVIPAAELISSFVDVMLKSPKEADEIAGGDVDDYFVKIVSLFGRVSDKDLFQEFYRKHLMRRLLSGTHPDGPCSGRLHRGRLRCSRLFCSLFHFCLRLCLV